MTVPDRIAPAKMKALAGLTIRVYLALNAVAWMLCAIWADSVSFPATAWAAFLAMLSSLGAFASTFIYTYHQRREQESGEPQRD